MYPQSEFVLNGSCFCHSKAQDAWVSACVYFLLHYTRGFEVWDHTFLVLCPMWSPELDQSREQSWLVVLQECKSNEAIVFADKSEPKRGESFFATYLVNVRNLNFEHEGQQTSVVLLHSRSSPCAAETHAARVHHCCSYLFKSQEILLCLERAYMISGVWKRAPQWVIRWTILLCKSHFSPFFLIRIITWCLSPISFKTKNISLNFKEQNSKTIFLF